MTSYEAKDLSSSVTSEHAEDVYVPSEAAELPYTPSAADERKLRRKLDLTILPWIMMMYFLSYMDRSVSTHLLDYQSLISP